MSSAKVLIIEDEEHISELVKYNLESAGYQVATAYDGEEGLKLVAEFKPELVILDLMLPKLDGISVCNKLRNQKETEEISIIMLTAKSSETDKIIGLEIGADDYITKPFSVRELQARVKTVLRRSSKINLVTRDSGVIKVEDLEIDLDKHEVRRGGQKYVLTLKEFQLLKMLSENRGKVLTRNFLLDEIWGYDYFGETRTVDVHIRHLRAKIDDENFGNLIETVRGVGYKVR